VKRKKRKKNPPSSGGLPRFIRVFCRALSILIGWLLATGALLVALGVYCNAPPASPPSPVTRNDTLRLEEGGTVFVEVRNGESAISLGRRLEEAGIIKTRYFWDLLFRIQPGYIKTGAYRFAYPASQLKIRSILISGRQILRRVTVPEGATLKKIARRLSGEGICGEEDFLAAAVRQDILEEYRIPGPTMEGYLYPDTYLFPPAFPPEKVIRAMADTFFRRLTETWEEALLLSPEELNRRVVLASIVEREYQAPDEAPLMAGVFYNRLSLGMALQSCATVEYVITEIQGKPHPTALYDRDTEINNPYNTYIRPGLPPGPISNPGIVALEAVFRPRESDFLYFRLVDPAEGRHYFSRTFDDHIRAAALYVKGSAVN
jgi:UPF0755 protein